MLCTPAALGMATHRLNGLPLVMLLLLCLHTFISCQQPLDFAAWNVERPSLLSKTHIAWKDFA
eukprot:1147678-Pelagomonas_calceolata.AAC.5